MNKRPTYDSDPKGNDLLLMVIESYKLVIRFKSETIIHVHIKDYEVIDVDIKTEIKELLPLIPIPITKLMFTAGDFVALHHTVTQLNLDDLLGKKVFYSFVIDNLAQKILLDNYQRKHIVSKELKLFDSEERAIYYLNLHE